MNTGGAGKVLDEPVNVIDAVGQAHAGSSGAWTSNPRAARTGAQFSHSQAPWMSATGGQLVSGSAARHISANRRTNAPGSASVTISPALPQSTGQSRTMKLRTR